MKGARGIHKEHSVEYCVDADIFLGSHWSIALSDLENVKKSDKMDKQGSEQNTVDLVIFARF